MMNALAAPYRDALDLRTQALQRAQNAWGPGAAVCFVMKPDQTLFTVSSGEPFAPRFFGAGPTWEEAFADGVLPQQLTDTITLAKAAPNTLGEFDAAIDILPAPLGSPHPA